MLTTTPLCMEKRSGGFSEEVGGLSEAPAELSGARVLPRAPPSRAPPSRAPPSRTLVVG